LAEPSQVHALSLRIPAAGRIFLGNSLPIREWDLASDEMNKDFVVEASRGANGIDGQLSTFLGFSEINATNWAVVGDLTALYDLSAPWVLRDHPVRNLNLVVINNGGGKIFHRMFHNPSFENSHSLNFAGFAHMWGWTYERMSDLRELGLNSAGPRIVEIGPDAVQTEEFWRRLGE